MILPATLFMLTDIMIRAAQTLAGHCTFCDCLVAEDTLQYLTWDCMHSAMSSQRAGK